MAAPTDEANVGEGLDPPLAFVDRAEKQKGYAPVVYPLGGGTPPLHRKIPKSRGAPSLTKEAAIG